MEDFKARAAATSGIEGVWAIQEYLESKRRDLDQKYDYRYSQLPLVFGRLLREGRIRREQLGGLSDEKRELIQRIASLRPKEDV